MDIVIDQKTRLELDWNIQKIKKSVNEQLEKNKQYTKDELARIISDTIYPTFKNASDRLHKYLIDDDYRASEIAKIGSEAPINI